MPRGIREILSPKGTMFIQGRVQKDLGMRVKAILEKEKISRPKFFKACCERFLEEYDQRHVRTLSDKLKVG